MDGLTFRQIALLGTYVLLSGAIAVFVHAGLQGEHGVAALREAEAEERRLTAELQALRLERTRLENKVTRLSDRYLDLDLLDERARVVLGRVRPDEMIVR